MNKYKIEFTQKETFIIDVKADTEQQAIEKAEKHWENGYYQEMGDLNVEVTNIYDVTDTDDPFNE